MRSQQHLRRIFILGLFAVLIFGAALLWTTHLTANAQTTATPLSIESIGSRVGLGDTDLVKVVFNIINWALGFLVLVALGFVIYGGFLWMTASGDEKRIEKAKRVILQALIGMVIVLLAWAIVLFVARFFKGATSNRNSGNTNTSEPCLPGTPGCIEVDPTNTFNISAIATCNADPDNPALKVARASNIAIFFNASVDSATVKTAVESTAPPRLMTERCGSDAGDDPSCGDRNTTSRPVSQQVYSANASTATTADPKSEWVAQARSNAVTYVHKSFDTTVNTAQNQLFESQRHYRLQVPMQGAADNLSDLTVGHRPLQHCQSSSGGPIPGETIDAKNCIEDTANNLIHWTFATSAETLGPPITVAKTDPTSKYKAVGSTATPDRDVDRDGSLCMTFSTAVDPTSVDENTFIVTKYQNTAPPTAAGHWNDGTLEAARLPATNFNEPHFYDGGRTVCIKPSVNYEAFTWYHVNVHDVRNLCGTTMEPPSYDWAFESNDKVPGVLAVYPPDGFAYACPATKAMIVFRTSMWNNEGEDCQVGGNSYVLATSSLTTGGASAGRTLRVADPWQSDQPRKNCRIYEFNPTTALLTPGATYTGAVYTNREIKNDGTRLEYGTAASGKPWSFSVKPVDQCVSPPIITRVSPSRGKAGQCVSVLGQNLKNPKTTHADDTTVVSGDSLTLGGRDQVVHDSEATWTKTAIVTTVDAGASGAAGSLEPGKQSYRVTVRYPAPIGDLSFTASDDLFTLEAGDGSDNVCLRSLSRTSGPPGTVFDATGRRFGTGGGESHVWYPYDSQSLANPTSWADRLITGAVIPSDQAVGTHEVSVTNAAGNVSNGIDFETTLPPTAQPGAPRVVVSTACNTNIDPPRIPSPNPVSGVTAACLNTQPQVQFDRAMNTATLTATNIYLEDCTTLPCTPVAAPVQYNGSHTWVTLQAPTLQPSHKYRATVTTNVQSSSSVPMAAPFTWQFTTQSDTTPCPIAAITLQESAVTFRTAPFTYDLTSALRSTSCERVAGSCGTYSWLSSKPTVATVAAKVDPSQALASSADEAVLVEGTTNATVSCQSKTSNKVAITYNQFSCTDNAQCQVTNGFGESCGTSSCVGGACVPVITGFVPSAAAPGSWATIHGCWFGSYSADHSSVTFGADTASPTIAGPFEAAICDNRSSWHNDYIIRAVPAGTLTGRVKVVRSDSAEATSATDFTINGVVSPGLCKAVPPKGAPDLAIVLNGTGFGTQQVANEPTGSTGAANLAAREGAFMVKVGDGTGTTNRAMTAYTGWSATSFGTRVPLDAAFGENILTVRKDGIGSNDIRFEVLNPAAASCITCDETTTCQPVDGVPQGCSSTSHCCAPVPVIISTNPAQGAAGVCRNVAARVTFSQPLATDNISSAVTYSNGGATPSAPKVSVQNAGGYGTLVYQPGLLAARAAQSLTVAPDVLRGTNGVLANVGGTNNPLRFTTGPDICTIDRLTLDPVSHLFYAQHDTWPIVGSAWAKDGSTLSQTPAYTWSWNWLTSNTSVVSIGTSATESNTMTAGNPGKANITLTAKVTHNDLNRTDKTSKSARAVATVQYCPNPWPTSGTAFTDTVNNCDVPGTCPAYDFSISYCRSSNADATEASKLPDFSYPGVGNSTIGAIEGNNSSLGRLKSMFFKTSATATDVIGILIYANPKFLTPADWFAENTTPGATAGQATTVGGFPALQVGPRYYVGVTHYTGSGLEGLMFILDYNSNQATSSTAVVFKEMIDGIVFNTNLPDDLQRAQLQRDTQRRQDLTAISRLLETYKTAKGSYPSLDAGSYVQGISTSKWPSWQANLGQAFGATLPVDPDNSFARTCKTTPTISCTNNDQCVVGDTCGTATKCAAPYENATCWSEATKQSKMPARSSVYVYQKTGTGFDLCANMEYARTGTMQNYDVSALTMAQCEAGNIADCRCFNFHYSLLRP